MVESRLSGSMIPLAKTFPVLLVNLEVDCSVVLATSCVCTNLELKSY